MEFEEYFYNVWNTFPVSVISDEYYTKNEELFEAVTFELFEYNQNSGGNMPSSLASVVLQKVFGNIQNFGLR